MAGRWLFDAALAVLAGAAAVLLTAEISAGQPPTAIVTAQLLAAAYGGVLFFRRAAPRGVLAAQAALAAGYVALRLPVFMLGPAVLVTMYTVASRLDRRTALTMLGLAEATLTALFWLGPPAAFTSWIQFTAMLAGAWFLGDVVRRWQVAAAAHARRAEELDRAREELARLAVTAERLRIARELHDVVAHSMSVIAMHAGSARLAAGRDPAAVGSALEVVEQASRDALAEMRRLVRVLRDADAPGPSLSPAPGLPDVHRLVAEIASAGVSVEVHTTGDLAAVPEGVSLAAYRIVQEALTNVVRHARPARAQLSVTVKDGEVSLEIVDDGAAVAVAPGGHGRMGELGGHGGLGTVGMRERASLYGGEFAAGPRPGGGWRVAARLPYLAEQR